MPHGIFVERQASLLGYKRLRKMNFMPEIGHTFSSAQPLVMRFELI
jgi:hypothetical protein